MALGALYASVVGAAYLFQRDLLYERALPGRPPGPALPLDACAPVPLIWVHAAPDRPTVLHFHGNGEQLADLAPLAALFTARGLGFAAVEYPGVGLAHGEPTEEGLLGAARAAALHLREHGVADADLVLSGQSLGSGVAVALASEGFGTRALLVSPYTALPDVGALRFPFLPVRLLMRDRFDSLSRAAQVPQPVLLVHGEQDAVIPVGQGKTLAAALPHVATLFVDGGHLGLFRRADVARAVVDFASGERAPQPR